jgi:hypothetical protein
VPRRPRHLLQHTRHPPAAPPAAVAGRGRPPQHRRLHPLRTPWATRTRRMRPRTACYRTYRSRTATSRCLHRLQQGLGRQRAQGAAAPPAAARARREPGRLGAEQPVPVAPPPARAAPGTRCTTHPPVHSPAYTWHTSTRRRAAAEPGEGSPAPGQARLQPPAGRGRGRGRGPVTAPETHRGGAPHTLHRQGWRLGSGTCTRGTSKRPRRRGRQHRRRGRPQRPGAGRAGPAAAGGPSCQWELPPCPAAHSPTPSEEDRWGPIRRWRRQAGRREEPMQALCRRRRRRRRCRRRPRRRRRRRRRHRPTRPGGQRQGRVQVQVAGIGQLVHPSTAATRPPPRHLRLRPPPAAWRGPCRKTHNGTTERQREATEGGCMPRTGRRLGLRAAARPPWRLTLNSSGPRRFDGGGPRERGAPGQRAGPGQRMVQRQAGATTTVTATTRLLKHNCRVIVECGAAVGDSV